MIKETGRPALVSDAIAVDEVGIESGIFGTYRLRSSYRPIFACEGDALVPVAVESLIAPHRNGRSISPERFFGQLAPEDASFIDNMCRALHVRNRRNIGVEALDLYFKYDPRAFGETLLVDNLPLQIAKSGMDSRSVVVEIIDPAALEPSFFLQLAAELRGIGVRVAITEYGIVRPAQHPFDVVKPEIVRMDGFWFQKLCRAKATVRLFGLLVSGFHERGATVLVTGIEDAAHLHVALWAGADLFSGGHLALPALVGTVFDEAPVSITGLMGPEPNVLRFAR